jgi:hypothetical protein
MQDKLNKNHMQLLLEQVLDILYKEKSQLLLELMPELIINQATQ